MLHWFIRKKDSDSKSPYTGPSCFDAGVNPGRWYEDEADARQDAAKLSSVNPVGFDVVRWVNPDHDFHAYDN